MGKIKERIIKILSIWINDGAGNGFDGIWYGYDALQDEIHINSGEYHTIKELKTAIKSLKNDEKVKRLPIYDIDGRLCGSGWFIKQRRNDETKRKKSYRRCIG